MPIPLIPLLIGGISLIAGGYGVKKGFDANGDLNKSKEIGENSEKRHKKSISSLNREKNKSNQGLKKLGSLKVEIFSNQINYLIDEIKKRKKSRATLKDFEQFIKALNLPELELMVLESLEIESGLASGTASGALIGLGAYGSVGILASASTGTAIASLSGAAATNATLAWLGGGALSVGGLGIAGGTAVLGGLVAGPAIAVTGFIIASKAEKALSEARAYESQVDQAIAQIDMMKDVLKGIRFNAKEMEDVLIKLTAVFEQCKPAIGDKDPDSFERLLRVGIALKKVLDTPILENNGDAVKNLNSKLSVVTSGFLEYY